ncbi:MAG TPA: GGDEF domain-containing protein [Azospira sp.]|nr:GGDEF domain-containing protein [Azospira sp.]
MTTLILASYLLILSAVAGLGVFVVATMGQLQGITSDLYIHPFAVSNAAAELKGSLFQLRNHMLQISVFRNRLTNMKELRAEATAYDLATRNYLTIIRANFLGDMERVRQLEALLAQWASTRQEIFAAAEKGEMGQAERLIREVATPTFNAIVPEVDYILAFARNRAKEFVSEAESETERKISQTRWGVALLILFIATTGSAVLKLVRSLHTQLTRQADLDFLTGIPNRRHFMELAERELKRSRRYGTPTSLALVDLDLFKNINDTHGHQVGDRVLQAFASVCRQTLRDSDLFGRIGGEEFAILLPSTGIDEAGEVVERVRKAVAAAPLPGGTSTALAITASFGMVEQSSAGDDLQNLLRQADTALYRAKENGRNQICIAPA